MSIERLQKYIFLDRDGTVIVDKHYLHRPEEVQLCDGVIEGLGNLQKSGFELVVVTNQSGIGRGFYSADQMHLVHERISKILSDDEIVIRDFLFCPHTPEANCDCRKPQTGLLDRFREMHLVDINSSWVIGDRLCDVEFAKNAGLRSVWIQNSRHPEEMERCRMISDHTAQSFAEAARHIVG